MTGKMGLTGFLLVWLFFFFLMVSYFSGIFSFFSY